MPLFNLDRCPSILRGGVLDESVDREIAGYVVEGWPHRDARKMSWSS